MYCFIKKSHKHERLHISFAQLTFSKSYDDVAAVSVKQKTSIGEKYKAIKFEFSGGETREVSGELITGLAMIRLAILYEAYSSWKNPSHFVG